jgi:uncharacterized membrane-anchored protein
MIPITAAQMGKSVKRLQRREPLRRTPGASTICTKTCLSGAGTSMPTTTDGAAPQVRRTQAHSRGRVVCPAAGIGTHLQVFCVPHPAASRLRAIGTSGWVSALYVATPNRRVR